MVLTSEQHQRTCNYWYTITERAAPHTAFTSEAGLQNWLTERGIALTQPLTKPGEWSSQPLAGSYVTKSHYTPEDVAYFNQLDALITTRTPSNGNYTLAKITETDGIRTVHTLNPNAKERVVFDYRESEALINPPTTKTPTIAEIIADGLDASVDGRGFGIEHLRATRLANSAPAMLKALNNLQANPNDPRAHREALDAINLANKD